MKSLRARLLVGVGAGVALALATSGIVVFALVQRSLVAQFDDGLRTRARALALLVEQEGGAIEYEDLPATTPAGEYFELRDRDRVLVRSTTPRTQAMREVTHAFTPRTEDDERPQTATLVFARDTAELDTTIGRIRTIIIVVALASVAVVLLLLTFLIRLTPIDRLARDIAAAGFDKRVDEAQPTELVVIAKRLNELLARLDRAFTRERELTAEVAHELRTPLAGLRATIELALDRERSPERYREALEQSLAITRQTERMVESMLSLARLDAGVTTSIEEVALDRLVAELAPDARVTPTTVRTDPTKLTILVTNLLDNARTYTAGGVEVVVEDRTITITNPTTLTDATHVFERFWRGDAARTAGTHAGLGLAIAKKLADLLGASLTATVRDGNFIAAVHFRDER